MRHRLPILFAVLAWLLCPVCLGDEPRTKPHEPRHQHDATATHPFDDVERWVRVFDDPGRAEWQKPDLIPAELGLSAGKTVADIGAGTGYFELFFSSAVGPEGKVYAVDVEPKMVEHLQERARAERTSNVVPVLGAPDDPRLPPAGVDVVFICDTWHHISRRLDYLRRLEKALKPGGTVAIIDFHKRELPVGPPPEHKIAREAVLAEFAEAGWALARESTILPHQYFLIFKPPPAPASK